MPTFTPPTDAVVSPIYIGPGAEQGRDPSGYKDSTPAMQQLMSRYAAGQRGRNVFLLTNGTITETQPATWQEISRVYWGGSANPITTAEQTALVAAGYGAYIA